MNRLLIKLFMCVSFTCALLSKNQPAVNVCKRSREEHCDYLQTVSFSGRESTIIALHLLVQIFFLATYDSLQFLLFFNFLINSFD